jgi:hypothetical protein
MKFKEKYEIDGKLIPEGKHKVKFDIHDKVKKVDIEL